MDNDYHQIAPKMSGYLERKERKTMISSYKRYWFVLDGTLLAYYRSKDEYTAISPCKGTITLGPTCHVKPCTSNNGVFQIESKTTTITLRAETKEDQHRWMQAIILALNQKMEYKKLNHFRHSVGEMPKPCDDSNNAYVPIKKPLSAQVSLHSRSSQQSLIDRLQRMGAKSYVGTISKNLQTTFNLPNYQAQKLKSFSTESLPYLSKQNMENLNKNLENLNNSKKNIAATSINSIYDTLDHLKDDLFFEKNIKSSPDTDEGIYERIPCNDEFNGDIQNHRTTLITSNDIYWDSKQLEYEEVEHPDINHNHHKLPTNEDDEVYTDIEQVGALADDNSNTEYMEIDPTIDYVVIQEADIENKTSSIRNSSSSSQESCVNEKKRRFGFGKKSKKAPDGKDKKVKKSESFLQRVLNKKSKNKKNATEDAEAIVQPTDLCSEETVKKLSELKNMLIQEKAMLYARQRRQSVTGEMESQNRESMLICNDLYSCSDEISGTTSTNLGDLPAPPTCPSLPPRNQTQALYRISSTEPSSSPIYMVPPLTQMAHPTAKQPPKVPPKRKKKVELGSSNLDAVLFDLNKDASDLGESRLDEGDVGESKDAGKVKELIRRYSHISEGEDVEIRKKKLPQSNLHSPTYPSELDKLLDELSKVTIAPIMTPGVTTSLINPEVADQEMLKMVSQQRRRRNSDPDYDIPRPHRSLTNLPKKDDNALEATRFFGPILKPSDLPNYAGRPITPPVDYSNLPSITPDSLEVECTKTNVTHDELHRFSYDSHDYKRFNKQSHYNLDGLESVYSEPNKFLMLRSNGYFSAYDSPMSGFHLESHESRFVDSLEP